MKKIIVHFDDTTPIDQVLNLIKLLKDIDCTYSIEDDSVRKKQ
jgi:hypothetical protein